MSGSEPNPRVMRPDQEGPGRPAASHRAGEPALADAPVILRYWAAAAHAAERDEEHVAGVRTVGDALAEASRRHPALADVLPACSILVDGLVADPALDLAPGMILEVLPPFAGG